MASFLSALTSFALFLALTNPLVAADSMFTIMAYLYRFLISLRWLGSIVLTTKNFDLHWPGAYCAQMKTRRCCMPNTGSPEEDFYVSIMATYTNDGTAVKKCSSSNFYINELSDLSESLDLHWPNIKCPKNDGKSNWRSIWKTFGVCTNMREHDHFKPSFVYASSALLGITPDGRNYSFTSIQEALENGIGQKVAVQCSKIYNTNIYQLFRIFFCVDKSDASTIVSCPFESRYRCTDEVVFSPFDVGMLKGFTVLPELNPIKFYPEHK
ncbi:unnamed protein product [Victoria cruziana]